MRRDSSNDDITRPLTGRDARPEEAEFGSAGNGAWAYGGDLTGIDAPADEDNREDMLEEDPGHPADISPDKVGVLRGHRAEAQADEDSYSARPHDMLRPISKDELPSDDPEAAEGDEDAQERSERAWAQPTDG